MEAASGGGGSAGGKDKYDDAKHMFDRIGEEVHKKVHTAALQRGKGLHGLLSKATFSNGERVHGDNPCNLNHRVHTNVTSTVIDPCKHKSEKRFSEVSGAECDNNKIRGSDKKSNGGACAPFRRLHVCDQNLEQIRPEQITSTHNLLVDVCMAAKFEGQSITRDYPKYRATYVDSPSEMCTMLARSFADIGDIIRGRDLYRGNKKKNEQVREKEKLELKLKSFFKQIHSSLEEKEKNHYNDDDPDFLKLREDWWTANRDQVWKALTCEAGQNDKYFRDACSGGKSSTPNKCRCTTNDVPTYFDYVPQYLRWFEEWAEDFCRKRKHKLQNAIDKCRGKDKSGNERYCDLNGFDCKGTARGAEVFVKDDDCHKCSVACSPFVKWIDNQKLEFEKQVKKYKTEISGGDGRGSSRKKRGAGGTTTTNYDGYEKKFYDELKKNNYGTVDKFLQLLNNETTCTKNSDIEEGGTINFKNVHSGKNSDGDGNNKTFYRTTYCEACPWCGTEKKGEKWEAKDGKDCANEVTKEYKKDNITDIPVLTPEKGKSGILKKYSKFCKNGANGEKSVIDGGQIKNWQCYYDDSNTNSEQNDNCVEGEWKDFKEGKSVMPYNAFFWKWVHDMLIDSIEWRNEHGKCINNKDETTCIRGCNTKCECFKKWVGQKGNEWKAIKEHFDKQNDIVEVGDLAEFMKHDIILEQVLNKKQLLQIIQDTYGNEKDIEHIRKMLDDDEAEHGGSIVTEQKSTIVELLKHEGDEAEKCKKTQEECEEQAARARARSENQEPPPAGPDDPDDSSDEEEEEEDAASDDDDDDDDEDDEDEEHGPDANEDTAVDGKEDQDTTEDTEQGEPAPPPASQDEVNPCKIVQTLFENPDDFKVEACNQKYGGNNSRLGWKCIPSGEKSGDTDTTGGLCIPPRRRKLYVTPLTTWAEEATKGPTSQGGGDSSRGGETRGSTSAKQSPSNPRAGDLLKAFVESAAIETFFLWHKYKMDKKKEEEERKEQVEYTSPKPEELDKKLKEGKIDDEFMRQMFYTLGDYRDILYSGSNDTTSVSKDTSSSSNDNLKNIVLEASGSTEQEKEKMEKIQEQLKVFFQNSGNQPSTGGSPSPSSVTSSGTEAGGVKKTSQSRDTPSSWWEKNAQHIWHGMICALTYDTNSGAKDQPPKEDESLKGALLENGTPKTKYEYKTVELKEDENSGAKTNNDQPLTLKNFVERPPYFRYLEEWGENFCTERKKRLEEIKYECRTDKVCSGYGEHCDENLSQKYTTFPDFNCPSCATSCSFYKRWIGRKKIEFTEQSNAFTKQKEKCQAKSDKAESGNGFCGTIGTYEGSKDFLGKLGSCKNNDNESGHGTLKGTLDFSENGETFKHTKHCDPCSKFKVKCKVPGHCDTTKGEECKSKDSIGPTDIGNGRNSAEDIGMVVSEDSKSGSGFEDDGLGDCADTGIFQGFRKEEWTCGNVCGYNVCKPKNVNGETFEGKANGEKQIIFIRALFKRWLEYFVQDYNKIRTKLKPCMNSSEGSKCINGYDKKHKCVKQWIIRKEEEWKKIKKHYLDKNENGDRDIKTFVSNILNAFQPQTDVKKATGHKELTLFESKVCNCTGRSEKKNGKESDIIDCMLDKLGEKAEKCAENHTQTSGENLAQCKKYTPPDDDDEPFEEEDQTPDEAKKIIPKICGDVLATTKPTEQADDKCDEKDEEEKEPEQAAKENVGPPAAETKAKEEVPPSPATPAAPPTIQPPQADEPFDPTILQTTIPFGVALALGSIAFLFLKKKTQAPVDLFSVINIPKGDYGTPTPKSKNRYIPYASDRHKGKTYIYMEGDSDSGHYYEDTTDITSSESEYEEMDINDIYVPGSPKYKTLIEVVLEPSKRDIPSGDIPNNDTPTNKFTDNEWNQLKKDFISNMLQNQPKDVPNDYSSGDIPFNTQPNTLYFNKPEEKPFITSIHDRNLYTGEEYSYNVNMVNNDIPMSARNDSYSGIDLINDSLSGNQHIDIYDEVLKRKENELFGTNHVKQTSIHSVAKLTNSDPIHNQLELFHKWLDRHRDMCEKWNNKEELLDKLNEQWNKDNNNSGNINPSGNTPPTSDIPSGKLSDIPSDNNIPSSNQILNTDVSIQIHMDNPKPINQFTNMDTILEDLEKYNEPYYDVQDDIYYDVHDHDTSTADSNAMDVPSKVQIEMDINTKLVKEKYPIADVWDI
ncbi:erythrocyte membrane protein 1 [Plasmodium falciparum RAJ116]|uniref:Erythrocyte membrane protein 1 n=2 Tax=Plasmodium falciparum TaxID=5833 RepID=A0A0L0CVI1_PLAFA|nr:erythrocyte membrane protein 1 [Plasmodium falciparum RAJ116]